jgi:hypothetical protein
MVGVRRAQEEERCCFVGVHHSGNVSQTVGKFDSLSRNTLRLRKKA